MGCLSLVFAFVTLTTILSTSSGDIRVENYTPSCPYNYFPIWTTKNISSVSGIFCASICLLENCTSFLYEANKFSCLITMETFSGGSNKWMCRQNQGMLCPAGFDLVGSNCYKYAPISPNQFQFYKEVLYSCSGFGGDILLIDSEETQSKATAYLSAKGVSGFTLIQGIKQNDVWKTYNFNSITNLSFFKWAPGEPSTDSANSYIGLSHVTYLWHAIPFVDINTTGYICQRT